MSSWLLKTAMLLATTAVTLAITPAWAKPPVIDKASVWATWPFADSEKYVSHEACGEPKDLDERKDGKKVYFREVCVRVVVQQSCGCRSFETSYRKYKGAAKYTHAGTSGSIKVDCPADAVIDDACKAQLAKEKAAREAEAKKQALCGANPGVVRVYTARRIDAYCPKSVNKRDDKDVCAKCELRMACYDASDASSVKNLVGDCQQKHSTAIKVVDP